MALQNIGVGNKDDAFYRYKRPRMITKIEGRGNGIKANVVNMVDTAKALGRPDSYTTKFFSCELGAQSKFDERTGTFHVNGAHDTAKLASLLENFIKKYVQCYGCGNLETEILISKAQLINLKCAACGFLSDVDMRDKLTTFIIKNPPEQKKGSKGKKAIRRAEKQRLNEGEVADEEQTKLKKEAVRREAAKKKGSSTAGSKDVASKSSTKNKINVSDGDHSPTKADDNKTAATVDSEDDDDIQWQTNTSAEAARQRIQEQLSFVTASMVMLSTNEEKPKSVKNSPERDEEKTKSKVNGNSNGVKVGYSHEKLVGEIKGFLNKGSSTSQLKSFWGSLSGTPHKIMDALFEALFEGARKGFSKEVTKKQNYLAAVTKEEGSQLVLLNAIGFLWESNT